MSEQDDTLMLDRLDALMSVYQQRRTELIKTHLGKFLVIAEAQIKGSFDSATEALSAALKCYREGEFVIKQVIDPDLDVYGFVNPYVRLPR